MPVISNNFAGRKECLALLHLCNEREQALKMIRKIVNAASGPDSVDNLTAAIGEAKSLLSFYEFEDAENRV